MTDGHDETTDDPTEHGATAPAGRPSRPGDADRPRDAERPTDADRPDEADRPGNADRPAAAAAVPSPVDPGDAESTGARTAGARRLRLSRPAPETLVVLGLVALAVVYHVWWLVRLREGQPVDVDEAGYLAMALRDLEGAENGGLRGLWDIVQAQTPHAPLVPLLAAPVLAVHRGILVAYTVELAALGVIMLATYGVASRLVRRPWAVLAAFVVLATPGIIGYSRMFSFALPAAAALTVALWALSRSERMTQTRWALLVGVAAGAAVLARTMAAGFLPGLGVGMILVACTAPRPARWRALGNVALAGVVGLVLALLWYWKNFDPVLDYLSGYGYGAELKEYGDQRTVLSTDWWIDEVRNAAVQVLHLPLLGALLLVFLAGLVAAILWLLRRPTGSASVLRSALRSPAAPLVVFVVAGYLALSSTANNGTGFGLPLVPPVVVLAVAIAMRLPWRLAPAVGAAVLAAVSASQLLVHAQVIDALDSPHGREVPVIGYAPSWDPRPPVLGGVGILGERTRFVPADKRWRTGVERLGDLATAHAAANGRYPVVAFATRDRIYNANALPLITMLAGKPGIPVAQITTTEGDTVAAYERALRDPARGQPNVVVTADDETRDFEPPVTQRTARVAVRRVGFKPFAHLRQDNGERLTLWWLTRGPAIAMPAVPPTKPSR